MTDRREFLFQATAGLGGLWTDAIAERLHAELASRVQGRSDEQIARDERFWARVRRDFPLNDDVLNLDHGWSNPASRAAVDQLVREARALEALPAEQLERIFFTFKNNSLRPALAQILGVAPAEIAIVRNATEALDTVPLSVPLRAGDEIVRSAHDYFAMLDALEQRQARDGVVRADVRRAGRDV